MAARSCAEGGLRAIVQDRRVGLAGQDCRVGAAARRGDDPRDLVEHLPAPANEHGDRAFGGQRERTGAPDAATRAGDQADLALQLAHQPSQP
jgi:hypothetical protein